MSIWGCLIETWTVDIMSWKSESLQPSVLAGFLWHCCGRGRDMPPYYCQVGIEIQASHLTSINTWKKGLLLNAGQGWEFWLPNRPPWFEGVGVPHECSPNIFYWHLGQQHGLITTDWSWKPQLLDRLPITPTRGYLLTAWPRLPTGGPCGHEWDGATVFPVMERHGIVENFFVYAHWLIHLWYV